MSKRIVIAGSCRTPIGKAGASRGNLSSLSALDLVTPCVKSTIGRLGVPFFGIDQVILGQCGQGSNEPNIARPAALKADIPDHVPAFTVNRLCGSGLQSIVSACQMIKAEDADVVLAGGSESMSNIPYVLRGARFGFGLQHHQVTDALWEGLTDPFTGELMGKTAENIAQRYEISRDSQDEFAVQSHQRAFRAIREGKFRSQIVPLEVQGKKVSQDEGVNQALTKQHLSLVPEKAFFVESGTVHAGNSCGISDGASTMLVMSLNVAKILGIKPEAEILGYHFAGCNPSYMGLGPVFAIPEAMLAARVAMKNVSFFEINEAFAAQVLACQRELNISPDQLNIWGGAIASGHPVGATGAILITKMIAILKDTGQEYGVVSMCIGGGQGGAIVIRNWKEGG